MELKFDGRRDMLTTREADEAVGMVLGQCPELTKFPKLTICTPQAPAAVAERAGSSRP